MPDNWEFVAAAYAVAALVLGGYWRMLARKEHTLTALRPGTAARAEARAGVEAEAGAEAGGGVRNDHTCRSRQLSKPGHPRPKPASRPPLP